MQLSRSRIRGTPVPEHVVVDGAKQELIAAGKKSVLGFQVYEYGLFGNHKQVGLGDKEYRIRSGDRIWCGM